MKSIKCELHEYLDDGCTVKVTYYDSMRQLQKYIKDNGIKNYRIERREEYHMITKKNIEELAKEIMKFLEKNNLAGDTCIYFNNKKMCFQSHNGKTEKWEETQNINPHDYLKYCAYDHILSMSFEGPFYDVINCYVDNSFINKFNDILNRYHVYYELGDSWNLTLCPSDDVEFEYTYYNRPKEKINLYMHSIDKYSPDIANIMTAWYYMSEMTGDIGSCVIGAGFEFELNNESYWMSECSPWQGSLSWEKHISIIEEMLERIGATKVHFNYGVLD